MVTPEQCRSLGDVRAAIDEIDRQIITLLAQRSRYVRAAAPFKRTEDAVRAPERVEAMLRTRREWATEARLDPAFVASLYRSIVEHFVRQELNNWKDVS